MQGSQAYGADILLPLVAQAAADQTFTVFMIIKIIENSKIIEISKWMALQTFLPDEPSSQQVHQSASQLPS